MVLMMMIAWWSRAGETGKGAERGPVLVLYQEGGGDELVCGV